MGSDTGIDRHRVACALVVLAALMTIAPLAAERARSELSVSVTVVRSCVVDAQPAVAGAPRLQLHCASGAARDVRVSESVRAAAPVSSSAADTDLRVLTLNF